MTELSISKQFKLRYYNYLMVIRLQCVTILATFLHNFCVIRLGYSSFVTELKIRRNIFVQIVWEYSILGRRLGKIIISLYR